LAPLPALGQAYGVAAVVNDELISAYDLQSRMAFIIATTGLPNNNETRQRLQRQALRVLIDESLQVQEARRLNVTVGAEEIEAAVRELETRNGIQAGRLMPLLQQRGVDPRTLLFQIRASIAWSKVIGRQIRPQVRVTDEEVNEAMNRLKQSRNREQIQLAEIFIPVSAPAQDENARRAAQRIVDQLRQGAPFDLMARQFSQSATASVGGDVGVQDIDQVDRELVAAVRNVQPGQIVGPIRASTGYYIIRVVNRRLIGTEAKNMPPVVSMAQAAIRFPETAKPADVAKIRADAKKASDESKNCGEFEEKLRAVNASVTNVRNVRINTLSPELQKFARELPLNKSSNQIALPGGLVVLMVCSRAADTALPSVEEMRNSLGQQRLSAMTQRYMQDLFRQAYIDIRS
ncbi:MAG: peptidylprolyl isomerase, partial [Alphaproteobacteria bacterium]